MTEDVSAPVERSSTRDVPKAHRLEYWSDVLSRALVPMLVTSDDPDNFEAAVTTTALGPLRVLRNQGGNHDSARTRREVARSGDRCFHLLINLESEWRMTHRHKNVLRPGDLILHDSAIENEINIRSAFDMLNFRLPVDWLRTWIPDPDFLVGRRIPRNSSWGTVLSPTLSQFRPELVAGAPLSTNVLADHIGAMLALVCAEQEKSQNADRALLARVTDCIEQRCIEPGLTAAQVADSLNISPRSLHRLLAAAGQSFAVRLLDARVARAVRMLRSARQSTLPLAEIARRSGFSQANQLNRVIRKRFARGAQDLPSR